MKLNKTQKYACGATLNSSRPFAWRYMILVLSFVFMLFFIEQSYALSIICEPEDPDFQNHAMEVKIDYFWKKDTWETSFRAPNQIDGLPFFTSLISDEDRGLAIYLRTELSKNDIRGYFTAREDFMQGLHLIVHYGNNSCSQSIKVDLKRPYQIKKENA